MWGVFKNLILLLFLLIAAYSIKAEDTLKVMIIDTGVDGSNYNLMKYVNQKNRFSRDTEDTEGHGTHVFGIIAENACAKVELIPCKAFYSSTQPTFIYNSNYCFARALEENVDVINYSAGGYEADALEEYFMRKLNDRKITVIAAAGNNHVDLKNKPYYPAAYKYPNIIPVGSLNEYGGVSRFSNYGLSYEVWRRGEEVESYYPGNTRVKLSGTSMATAKFTGELVKRYCTLHK